MKKSQQSYPTVSSVNYNSDCPGNNMAMRTITAPVLQGWLTTF